MKYKLDDYKVGEIAKFYGISVDTVRFYDRKGVLRPEKKNDNNYRSYNKEEFITMDYIMRLRSLGVSIENIKKMVVNTTLRDSLEVIRETEAEIEAQIAALETQRRMIRGYRAKLKDCADVYGEVTLEQSPVFIIKDIQNNSMKETMDAFEKLQLPTLPLLGILIDCEDYDSINLHERFVNRVERQKICSYVVAVADYYGISSQLDFPKKDFELIPARACAHVIGADYTNADYSYCKKIYDFIEEKQLKIAAPPLLRILAMENRGSSGVEYTEMWIPVESTE